MSKLSKAACIGGGVIGAGWVARLILNGIDVSIFDPDLEAERKVNAVMTNARAAYRQMTPSLPKEGKITATQNFVSQPGEDAALRKATFEESIGWYSGITADMFS